MPISSHNKHILKKNSNSINPLKILFIGDLIKHAFHSITKGNIEFPTIPITIRKFSKQTSHKEIITTLIDTKQEKKKCIAS